MDILDMILGADMANEHTDSQRLGYIEYKTLRYDGNLENAEVLSSDSMPDDIGGKQHTIKILNDPIDLSTVTKILAVMARGYTEMVGKEHFRIEDIQDGMAFLYVSMNGMELPIIATFNYETMRQTVVFHYENVYGNITCWPGYIEYDEVIHQIDPKFIPNVVIDLSQFPCESNFGTNFNTAIFSLFGSLLQSGGGSQVIVVKDIDGKLKKACTDAHNFKVRIWKDDNVAVDIPASYSFDRNNGAAQISGSFITFIYDMYIESKMNILFSNDSNHVAIFNQVTIINAG